jgi:hypothetical protein
MLAPNFRDMEYNMPMVCGGLESFDEMAKAYEEETGEEYSEGLYEGDLYNELETAEQLAEEFSNSLTFHDVTIESGYYSGFQFWVEKKFSNYFDLDKSSEYCINNDDAHYYFDMFRSQTLRAADAEKRKIAKWLEKLQKNGFEILVCTAKFTNGEAIYSRATPRTKLIAAAIA